MSRRRVVTAVSAIAVSAGLLVVVVSQLQVEVAWATVRAARPSYLLAGLAASLLVLLIRGWRFRILTLRAEYAVVVRCTAVHNLLLRVTPLRLGELSLPYLLARYRQEPAAETVLSLLLIRVLELVVLLFVLLVAALAYFGGSGMGQLWVFLPALLALAAVIATFSVWIKLVHRLMVFACNRLGLSRVAVVAKGLDKLGHVIDARQGLSPGKKVALGLATLGVVLGQLLMLGLLMAAFSVEFTPLGSVVATSIAIVASALPVASVGTFGTHETGWALGFMWVGVDTQPALATGIATGLITLAYAGIFALPAALSLRRKRANSGLGKVQDEGRGQFPDPPR